MKNKAIKIIASAAIVGSAIVGGVAVDHSIKKMELVEKRSNLINKLEKKIISHSEYLQLIGEYNAEIKKNKGEMKLEKVNDNNSIIDRMNQKIVK